MRDKSVQLHDLVSALGTWTTRTGPRYARLADAIADAVAQGLVLGAGTRLPAERRLAERLRVSRGTVVAAYDALRARGVVETRRGSGTVVLGAPAAPPIHRAYLLSRLVDRSNVPIDLSIAAVDGDDLPDLTVSLREAARLLPPHGYAPLGIPALREAIADHHSRRGLATAADQVIVTAGGQGALTLIASGLVARGDRVLVEAPTYSGAIEVLARTGARVKGIERDEQGPRLDELERALARERARVLYLVPTCHNPTGSVMSERRRREVLRLAAARGVMVVEDTVLEDLLLDGTPPPSMASIDGERVLTVGSLSKTVWGGLRVGWVRGPSDLIMRLGRVKASLDLGIPAVGQAIALQLLADLPAFAERRREQTAERLALFADELRARLPEWTFTPPRGGWSIWVRLPRGSGDDLAALALRRGVAIAPGRTAAPGDEFANYVRVSVGPPPELLREGAIRLEEAWEELCSLPMGAGSEPAFTV